MDGDIIEPKERDLSVQGLFGYTHVEPKVQVIHGYTHIEPKELDIGSGDKWIH